MTQEKQGPYPPADNPPAYPGPATPQAGYGAPPPGAYQGPDSPQAGYSGPPPGSYPPPQGPYSSPQAGYPPGQGPQYQAQYGVPTGYAPGQPVLAQPAMQQVVVVQQNMFRQSPVNTVCPHCAQNIITSTRAEAGGLTWLLCAGICLFGFWLGCCLIPFCIDDCQDITHSCPNCKNTIHVFKRL